MYGIPFADSHANGRSTGTRCAARTFFSLKDVRLIYACRCCRICNDTCRMTVTTRADYEVTTHTGEPGTIRPNQIQDVVRTRRDEILHEKL